MKPYAFLILLLSLIYYGIAQPPKKDEWYIIARATRSKAAIIYNNFNLFDSTISHVGFAKQNNSGNFYVYHINPVNNVNAFIVDSLEGFLSPPDIFCYSLWRLSLTIKESNKLKKFVESYLCVKVEFDFDFDLNNSYNKLYCSEFVWLGLNAAGLTSKPWYKNLKESNLKYFLEREEIYYIPPDFFENLPFVNLMRREFFKQGTN